MIITSLQIKNLRHFEVFSTKMAAVSLITGDHGVGKTSLIELLKYAYGYRGIEHDPEMLRIAPGVEEGEIIITHDDSTIVRCVVTQTDTTRMVKVPGITRWSKSRSDLDALVNALSYDPLKFGDLSPRDQINTLLKIMPIPVDAAEIKEAVGPAFAVPEIQTGQNGLEAINQFYDQIYTQRTKVGQSAETLKGFANKTKATLTPVSADGQDWSAVASQLAAEIDALRKCEADAIERLRKVVAAAIDERNNIKTAAHSDIDKEINDKIRTLEIERQSRKETATRAASDAVESEKVKANIEIKEVREELYPQITRLTEEAATARERSDSQKREEGNRQAVTEAETQAAAHDAEYASMTTALKNLTSLKATVAGRMKIKGIQIAAPKAGMEVSICREEGGALVPFNIWNDESKLMLMLRLATMSHGKCGLICIDSLGDLNQAKQAALINTARKYAKSEGLQFVLGRADEPGFPLRVIDANEDLI